MKITDALARLFKDVVSPARSGELAMPEPDEVDFSETQRVVAALVSAVELDCANKRRGLSVEEIMDMIYDLPDVREDDDRNNSDDYGNLLLMDQAMRAVDDLIRKRPEISSQWSDERFVEENGRPFVPFEPQVVF